MKPTLLEDAQHVLNGRLRGRSERLARLTAAGVPTKRPDLEVWVHSSTFDLAVKRGVWFRGTSVRAANGVTPGLPTFGRFAARVETREIRVFDLDDCDPSDTARWAWTDGGVSGYAYETEVEARDAAEAHLLHEGWTRDPEEAKREAIAHARARHRAKCSENPAYKFVAER